MCLVRVRRPVLDTSGTQHTRSPAPPRETGRSPTPTCPVTRSGPVPIITRSTSTQPGPSGPPTTPGRELLDVLRMTSTRAPGANDRSSPSRSIVFSPATRTRPSPGTSAASRATGSKPPRTPSRSIAAKHASERFATDSFPGASDRQRPGRMRSSQAPSPTTGNGTQSSPAAASPRSPAGGNAARYDQAVARTANTANTTAEQRSAATQQLRGTFADNARDRKLVDELIVERRAEALAEDHAADAPQPRPRG